MQRPPGRRRWLLLLWWVAAAAAVAAPAPDPVVGAAPAQAPARPRFKGRASEGTYGRTHASIVSGKHATSQRFPYQVYVRIFLRNGTVDFCGGAIVGVRHILTAAHCVNKPNVMKKMAVIGSMNRFGRNALNFTITHQTFYPKKSGENVDADIVVLMVDRSMPLGKENVKLVELQSNRSFNRGGLCFVAGWGESRGDSGGPLVCSGKLTGIVKGGVGCGLPHFPGTYTDVSYYSSWVEGVMIDDWQTFFKQDAPSPFRRKWRPHPRRARHRTWKPFRHVRRMLTLERFADPEEKRH